MHIGVTFTYKNPSVKTSRLRINVYWIHVQISAVSEREQFQDPSVLNSHANPESVNATGSYVGFTYKPKSINEDKPP